MPGSGTDTPQKFRACNAWYTRHVLNIGEKQFIHWKKKPGLIKTFSYTLDSFWIKNARKTEFAPKSSWHVPAYEFQSFRAASRVLDTENDKYAAVLRNKLNEPSYGIFVHREQQQFDG